jgi:hypothetical protein
MIASLLVETESLESHALGNLGLSFGPVKTCKVIHGVGIVLRAFRHRPEHRYRLFIGVLSFTEVILGFIGNAQNSPCSPELGSVECAGIYKRSNHSNSIGRPILLFENIGPHDRSFRIALPKNHKWRQEWNEKNSSFALQTPGFQTSGMTGVAEPAESFALHKILRIETH